MNKTLWVFLILLACGLASAGELQVSSKEPVVVMAPDQWKAVKDKSPSGPFPLTDQRGVGLLRELR
jgi:hypothetical protein